MNLIKKVVKNGEQKFVGTLYFYLRKKRKVKVFFILVRMQKVAKFGFMFDDKVKSLDRGL
jgi:hypothetical protein